MNLCLEQTIILICVLGLVSDINAGPLRRRRNGRKYKGLKRSHKRYDEYSSSSSEEGFFGGMNGSDFDIDFSDIIPYITALRKYLRGFRKSTKTPILSTSTIMPVTTEDVFTTAPSYKTTTKSSPGFEIPEPVTGPTNPSPSTLSPTTKLIPDPIMVTSSPSTITLLPTTSTTSSVITTTPKDDRIDAAGREPNPVIDEGVSVDEVKQVTQKNLNIDVTPESIAATTPNDDPYHTEENNDKVDDNLSNDGKHDTSLVQPSIPFITDLTGSNLGIGAKNNDNSIVENETTKSDHKVAHYTTKAADSSNINRDLIIQVVRRTTQRPVVLTQQPVKTTVFFTTDKYETVTPQTSLKTEKPVVSGNQGGWVVLPAVGEVYMESVPDPTFSQGSTNPGADQGWVVLPNVEGHLDNKYLGSKV